MAPLSTGFSRQEHWSGLPCPPPGDLPNPGIEPRFPALQADSLPAEPQRKSLLSVYNWYREKNYVVALMHMALTLKGNCARLLSNDYKDVWVL